MKMEYEDYEIPSTSGDSKDSFSDGWADHRSKDKEYDEDVDNRESVKFISQCKKKMVKTCAKA